MSQRRINIIIFNSALRPVDRLPTTSSLTRFLTWQPDILAWVRVSISGAYWFPPVFPRAAPFWFRLSAEGSKFNAPLLCWPCPRLLSASLLPSTVLLRPTAAHIPTFVARAGVRNGPPSPTHARINTLIRDSKQLIITS